jgi:ketosteroid isomerase-like protein
VRPSFYGNPAGLTHELEVVRAIYAAFAARDVEAALTHIADDFELCVEGTARIAGRDGPYKGHAGMRVYLADVERVWDELTLHADDFRVMPGSVVVMGHVTGVYEGRRIARAALWTWRLRDGLAVSARVTDLGEARASGASDPGSRAAS